MDSVMLQQQRGKKNRSSSVNSKRLLVGYDCNHKSESIKRTSEGQHAIFYVVAVYTKFRHQSDSMRRFRTIVTQHKRVGNRPQQSRAHSRSSRTQSRFTGSAKSAAADPKKGREAAPEQTGDYSESTTSEQTCPQQIPQRKKKQTRGSFPQFL